MLCPHCQAAYAGRTGPAVPFKGKQPKTRPAGKHDKPKDKDTTGGDQAKADGKHWNTQKSFVEALLSGTGSATKAQTEEEGEFLAKVNKALTNFPDTLEQAAEAAASTEEAKQGATTCAQAMPTFSLEQLREGELRRQQTMVADLVAQGLSQEVARTMTGRLCQQFVSEAAATIPSETVPADIPVGEELEDAAFRDITEGLGLTSLSHLRSWDLFSWATPTHPPIPNCI